MVRCETGGDVFEHRLAAGPGVEREFFERPRFAGSNRQPFGVDDNLKRRSARSAHAERAAEATTRCERERLDVLSRRRERQQTVEGSRVRRFKQFVVLRVGVLTVVHRRAQRAAGLREHLKAFAVEPCGRRHCRLDLEEDDFLDADRLVEAIGDRGSAQGTGPRTRDVDAAHVHGRVDGHDTRRRGRECRDVQYVGFAFRRTEGPAKAGRHDGADA